MTTGCSRGSGCHNKTEVLDLSTKTWSDAPDYPFGWIVTYSTISTSESAYIIGGSRTEDIIAQFTNFQWYLAGNLKQKRKGSGSILIGNWAVIIGGWRDRAFQDE